MSSSRAHLSSAYGFVLGLWLGFVLSKFGGLSFVIKLSAVWLLEAGIALLNKYKLSFFFTKTARQK